MKKNGGTDTRITSSDDAETTTIFLLYILAWNSVHRKCYLTSF